ncbi:DNA polymerase alpha-binding protein [[Candida] railenensis]|uniref:DNA polymerase alpha-binding protein n=1 Tax=[Candida] railenensis TaxID=45579 RepID=A0A9P0QRA1_9ASCO|nr:DNA polymerase alpha-binding protein [[Candida] railenensis]
MSENRITAFPDGNSFVFFDTLNSKLVVGNSGGLIKIFKPNEPELEPTSIDILENLANLFIGDNKVLVSTTSGKLECVDLLTNESKGDLLRSELPLRDAVFINESKRVIAGGDDAVLHVIDLQTSPSSILKIPVPNSVLNVDYNPTGEMVSVSLSNGDVQIYSVINERPNLLDTIKSCIREKINTSMDEIDYVNEHRSEFFVTKTQWSPNGEYLLTPSGTNKNRIDVFNRSDWSAFEFSIGKESDSTIVDFALSPNGKYLVTVDQDSQLDLFDFQKREHIRNIVLTNTSSSKLPLNLSWSNIKNGSTTFDLFIGTTNGDFLTVNEIISRSTLELDSLFLNEAEEDEADEEEENELADDDGSTTDALLDMSDTDVPLRNRHHQEDSMVIDEDDADDIDRRSISDSRRKRPYRSLNGSNGTSISHLSSSSSSAVVIPNLKPFSPGSTPWNSDKSANTSRRYLSMNSIGYTWAVKSDDTIQQQSITVSFFDRAMNKDYHFTDYSNFDLCSMNSRGILLASSGFEKSGGNIFYRHHESLQDSWDHQIPLIAGEYITAVTISNKSNANEIIIVGTNYGYIRFFNLYGVCVYLMKSTPVISLISSGTVVFIINQVSSGTYTYSVLNIAENYKYVQQDVIMPLTVSTKRQHQHTPLIKGVFFNENNDPCIVGGHDDTLIILSSWRQPNNGKWIPILNIHECITEGGSNESKRNWNSWPLGLYKDQVSVLILKSGNKFPGFPLPLPVELPIKLPVKFKRAKKTSANEEDEDDVLQKEQQENLDDEDPAEAFLRALTMGSIVHEALTNKEDEEDDDGDEDNDEIVERLETYSVLFDKSLLKIFAQSCQDAQLSRAFSVAKLIKTDKALFAASKIAERMEFLSLATRIGKLREDLLDD